MTLATGQPQSDRRHRCAFTLIELILVLALLVIAVSIVAPRMAGFVRGRALDAEARRLLAVMHAGQSRAVSEGMTMMLWIDQQKNAYGLEQESPGRNGDTRAQAFAVDANLRIAALHTGTSGTTTFKNLPAVRFLTDGSIDEGSPGSIQIEDAAGSVLWLVEKTDRRGYEIQSDNK